MSKIIDLAGGQATIAEDSGKVIRVPIATIKYSSPRINDEVKVFRDGKSFVVTREDSVEDAARSVNKNIFVWVGCFLFGWTGADRHLRGQHGLGILKLLTTTLMPIILMITFAATLFALPFDSLDCRPVANSRWTYSYGSYSTGSSHYHFDSDDYDYDCEVTDEFVDEFFESESFVAMVSCIMLTAVSSVVGGIWCLVDWIISLVKAYGGNRSDKLNFDERGHYLN